MLWAFILGIILGLTTVAPVAAQWDNDAWIGPGARFHVTDIKARSDEAAYGKLVDLEGFQPFPVELRKGTNGEIYAEGKALITGLGLKMDVNYAINKNGLEAKGKAAGMAKSSGKPITDATFTVSPDGSLRKGTGKVEIGNLTVPCSYTIEGKKVKVDGFLGIAPVKKETAMATYTFKGNLAVRFTEVGPIERAVTVNSVGSVERKGKLTGISDTYGGYDEPVNPYNGEVKLNVSGVEVVFDLW